MTWLEIFWIMMAAASLTLALIHLFIWFKQRSQYAHLLFFSLAISAAAFGPFELAMMHAQTPAAFATALRWAHVPLCAFVLSIVGFVYFYFDTGRPWLAYATCGIRLLALALNFTTGPNVNFREISAIDQVVLWGGAVISGPVGIASPWAIVPQISNLLLLAFVADASVALWRRDGLVQRRRAALVGGSLLLCIIVAAGWAALVVAGLAHGSTVLMPGFFIVVLAMGYELGWDVIAAAQLAARLRSTEARFRAVVEAVPNAILLVDDRGSIALTNAQVQTVFGYGREEIVGQRVEKLIPQRFRVAHEDHRRAYAADPQARAMGAGRELHARRKDGGEIPVEVALSPMQTADGLFVLVSVVDVTERRRSEQAAARQRNELAHLSRVATLGALSGSLAHELNQPLAAILSNAQAARRFLGQSPPRLDQVSEIIDDIVKSDRRAAAVIGRLRSMLRKEEAEHGPLDINEVVQETLHLMRSDLLNRRVAVASDFAPALPAVSGDRIQLQQVLLNFMVNGCEAMGGELVDRLLVVRTRQTEQGNVEVAVADHGTGIPPERLSQIFEPFITTKVQGMGLGLAICKTIAEAHGGSIWATNNADRGATLHFELPASAG